MTEPMRTDIDVNLAAFNFFGGGDEAKWALVRGALEAGTTAADVAGAPGSYVSLSLPPPSGTEDTAAFNAALAALPLTTVSGVQFRVGTIQLGDAPKTNPYKFGVTAETNNVGPLVNILGRGPNATWVKYYGNKDCFRATNTSFVTGDFTSMQVFFGTIDGMTIEGASSGVGACGLRYGDVEGGTLGPSLFIRDFAGVLAAPAITLGTTLASGGTFAAGAYTWVVTAVCGATNCQESLVSNTVGATLVANGRQVLNWAAVPNATGYRIYRQRAGGAGESATVTYLVANVGAVTTYTDTGVELTHNGNNFPKGSSGGSVGLCIDNQVNWTENTWARVSVYNCQTAVVFNACGGTTGTDSFGYNDFNFKVYIHGGQSGLVLQNGVRCYGGSLDVRANANGNPTDVSAALLLLRGAGPSWPRPPGTITQASTIYHNRLNIHAETGSGGTAPYTLLLQSTDSNAINRCFGVVAYYGTWRGSNAASNTFIFTGVVEGDAALGEGIDNVTPALAVKQPVATGVTGYHLVPPWMMLAAVAGSFATGANTVEYSAFTVLNTITIDRVLVSVATSSGNVCAGIYDSTGTGGGPGARLSTSGSVACPAAGPGWISIPPVVLPPGSYYAAITADNGTASFEYATRAALTSYRTNWRYNQGSFPLPNPAAPNVANLTNIYMIFAGKA